MFSFVVGAIVTGIAGAVAEEPGLFWPGAGLALINPDFEEKQQRKAGMVAIDLQVINGRTLRVVSAFRASGTFKAAEAKSGWSLFGYSERSHDFAQSVLGQATQLALNDAAQRISTNLIH